MDEFKLLLPIRRIPADSIVIKVNGSTKYNVVRMFEVIFTSDDPPQQAKNLYSPGGSAWLQDNCGHIYGISGDTEVLWVVTAKELQAFVTENTFSEGD